MATILNIWRDYKNLIRRHCTNPNNAKKDLEYWRNNLFADSIVYVLPFCIIALLPGIYWSFHTGQPVLALIDIVAAGSLVTIAFISGISIRLRKIIFISCGYLLSCLLLYYIGMEGPGLIYLQASCIFCILIFPPSYAIGSAILNTIICIALGAANHMNWLPWPDRQEHSVGQWIAVSSNVVFISFLSAALIPKLFEGLQLTIQNEKLLRRELRQKKMSLEKSLNLLEQKNGDLEQFAYTASHDLQEPLRMITGFLSQLEKKYANALDDKAKQYINFAVDGAQRMRDVILDLLEFSRAGRTADSLEEVDLNELVQDVEILFRKQIEEKKAVLYAHDLPVIVLQKPPLRQVFQNLISNALKYARNGEPPRIRITSTETATHWHFSIADNGIGIAREYFDRIFLIFQRLHPKNEYGGTGIGLALCKKIVESLHGNIWLESEVGKGSIFHFSLPKQAVPRPNSLDS